jgi:hypothetical protein
MYNPVAYYNETKTRNREAAGINRMNFGQAARKEVERRRVSECEKESEREGRHQRVVDVHDSVTE